MAPRSFLLGILNGSYGIYADELFQYLSTPDIINVYDSVHMKEKNLNNVHHPIHAIILEFKTHILKGSAINHKHIARCFDDLMMIFLLINEFHHYLNLVDFFDYIVQTNQEFSRIISIFVMIQKKDLVSQFIQYLIKNGARLIDSAYILNQFDCSFLAFGRYPEFAEFLVDLYVTNRNTTFYDMNKNVLNSFVSKVFVSLSVWGHFDVINRLLHTYTEIQIHQLKLNCKHILSVPLLFGLTDVMEYWYDEDNMKFLSNAYHYIGHLIPEQSWFWLSHPTKQIFWEKGKILTKQILQNNHLMSILAKSSNFQYCITNEAIKHAMELDRIDSFDLLIDNLPSDYVFRSNPNRLLSNFLYYFRHSSSFPAWYNYTDEDDKILFENDELTFDELEKRKRIRYYGRRILQIKGIEKNFVILVHDDFFSKRIYLFKWIGSTSSNDNFDYESVIKKLKYFINLKDVICFQYNDFVSMAKSVSNNEEFEKYQKAIENGKDYKITNNVINKQKLCLSNALTRSAPIDNVLFILNNSQLFEGLLIDSTLKEDIDFKDYSLLIKLLFGLYNCQNNELRQKEHFKRYKQDIEESREQRKLNGEHDIFEAMNQNECIILDDILHGFISPCGIVSNLYICKLLKEKFNINLTVTFHNLCELLLYPSLIEELPDDFLIKIINNTNNQFFQTSFGKIVFKKDFSFSYGVDDENHVDSLNLMKRSFDVAKNHLPTITIYSINIDSIWLAQNYPAQIKAKISHNYENESMDMKFYSILANKHAIINFPLAYEDHKPPIELLNLFGNDGLRLEALYFNAEIDVDKYPSLNFLKYILQNNNELKVKVTLKTLEDYSDDPSFKEIIINHKSQIKPDWYDISIKQIEKYYKAISIMQPCIIDLDKLTGLLDLWSVFVKRANKYPNLFTLQYSEDLLNKATENIKLQTLNAFSKLGLPAKFSYNSIQKAFEKGYFWIVNWWAKSGLLDPRFKLNLDKVTEDEKMLNWANENKHLIDSCSYLSVGIVQASDMFKE